MTFLLLLKSFWPALVGVGGALLALFFHQKTQTAVAEKEAAQANAAQSDSQATAARADAVAANSALNTVQTAATDRASIDATVAAAPASDVDAQLLANGFGK